MEDRNKIDELFNRGLDSFEAEPPIETWDNIRNEMDEARRKRRVAFWRFAGTAAALVLAFFSGYYLDLSTNGGALEVLDPAHKQAFELPVEEAPAKSLTQETEKTNFNREGDENIAETSAPTIGTQKSADPIESSSNPVVSASQGVVSQKAVSKKANGEVLANSFASRSDQSKTVSQPAKADNQQPVLALKDKRVNAQQSATSTDNNNLVEASGGTDKPGKPTEAGNGSEENKPQTNPKTEEDEPFVYTELDPPKKKKTRNSRLAFDVAAVAAPTYAFANASSPTSSAAYGNNGTTTNSLRDQSDQINNSYAAGLNFSYRTKNRIEVSTGLHLNNWSQVSSDVLLLEEPYSPGTANGSKAIGNLSTGNIIYEISPIVDATRFENVGPNAYYLVPDVSQQYQFLEVPITVGYYLLDAKRLSFKVQAGFSGRFLTQSNVRLLFADGTEESYDGLAVQNFSLQLLGGTGIAYKLSRNVGISLTPTLLYGLTPVNTNDQGETYFHQFLVYGGLNYRF